MKIIEITLLLLGSVIGAGFATGAEIITFFRYGTYASVPDKEEFFLPHIHPPEV